MSMTASIEALLKTSIGLDPRSIGSAAVARAVQERLSATGSPDMPAYWDRLHGSAAELQELIETVVVPETWFFRDPQAFATLSSTAVRWLALGSGQMLRVLSLPSSTGEEPYAMAMALLDAGVPADRFRIDAVDISARALARARRGVYGRNAFRSTNLAFRNRHFDRTEGGHRVHDDVRRQVHFQQGNLIDPASIPVGEPYDVIFCRNLLIYFDRPTQESAVVVLGRLLSGNGLLCVAPSETALLLNHGFASTGTPLAFALRKRQPGGERLRGATPLQPAAPTPLAPFRTPRRAAAAPAPVVPPIESPGASLAHAAQLADQGRLEDGAARCEAYLGQHPTSADAYCLLGVINEARGKLPEAGACYRKAVYLNPSHHESLAHLALLLEHQGRRSDAQIFRARSRRLEQMSAT